MIKQHRHGPLGRGQIADQERDRARRGREGVTQRNRMIDGSNVLDNALRDAHRLIGKPLQPEDPRKEDPPRHPLIEQEPDGVRTSIGGDITIDLALEVTPRAGLVPQVMQHDPGHSIADHPISRIDELLPWNVALDDKDQRKAA